MSLLSREEFYSHLTEENVTEEDYQHAQRVRNEFNFKMLGKYHDLYLKTKVLVLSDILKNFHATCIKNYGFEAAHYFSSSSLVRDAVLKMMGVKLELMKDREMHNIVDKGIRGEICNISHKHTIANNSYIPETYDKNLHHLFCSWA